MRKKASLVRASVSTSNSKKSDWQSHKENIFSSFFREYVEVRAIFSVSVTAVYM